jgi:RHS repeat-associated protein
MYSYDPYGNTMTHSGTITMPFQYADSESGLQSLRARCYDPNTEQTWETAEGLPLLIQDGTTNEIDGPDGLPLEQVTGSGTVSYYVHDQLGSTMALVASGGQIASTYDYDAYGALRASTITGGIDTTFRYAGQDADPESGLQYLQARYYDPGSSQFLTVDPLAASTGEPYGYTAGDPLNAIDPSGADPVLAAFILGGAILGGGIDAYQQYEQNCGSFNNFNWGEFAGAAAAGALTGLMLGLDPADVIVAEDSLADGQGAQVLVNKAIGDQAADDIAVQYPGASREEYFPTSLGPRRVDILTGQGEAIESKGGRTALTSRIRVQIAKDVELGSSGRVTQLTWRFRRSPTTGLVGPTASLMKALIEAGIKVVIEP